MTTKTQPSLSGLIESTNIPATLVRSVVNQLGGWESFTESAHDIASNGIDGGFPGFIYYTETEAFAKANRADIAALASQQSEDFGTGVFEMIRNFGCFKGDKISDEEIGQALYAGENTDDGVNMLNALAWYAGEEVARAFVDYTEQN